LKAKLFPVFETGLLKDSMWVLASSLEGPYW
jgi:hypothetical protein